MKLRLRSMGLELFEDCVGFLDGTIFSCKLKPFCDNWGIQYVNHWKKAYSLQATIISDDLGRIVHFSSIYPTSVHDERCRHATRIWHNSGKSSHYITRACQRRRYIQPTYAKLWCHIEEFLARKEFLIADSAYPETYNCMVPYKTPRGRVWSGERRFNRKFYSSRIWIEQTIRGLKHRFAYLKNISNKGNLSQDWLKEVYKRSASVVILHNLL